MVPTQSNPQLAAPAADSSDEDEQRVMKAATSRAPMGEGDVIRLDNEGTGLGGAPFTASMRSLGASGKSPSHVRLLVDDDDRQHDEERASSRKQMRENQTSTGGARQNKPIANVWEDDDEDSDDENEDSQVWLHSWLRLLLAVVLAVGAGVVLSTAAGVLACWCCEQLALVCLGIWRPH